MNKRGLLIVSVSLICIILVTVGVLHWYSEQRAEQKLQFYIGKLESRFTVEERPLSDFDVEGLEEAAFCSDFTLEAEWESVDHIYFDRELHNLYFLKADENEVTIYIFNYKKLMWD